MEKHSLAFDPLEPPEVSLDDQLFSFAELARHLRRCRPSRKLDSSSIFRWHRDGRLAADGAVISLPAVRQGRTLVTSLKCVAWFFRRLAYRGAAASEPSKKGPSPSATGSVERTARRLGLRPPRPSPQPSEGAAEHETDLTATSESDAKTMANREIVADQVGGDDVPAGEASK